MGGGTFEWLALQARSIKECTMQNFRALSKSVAWEETHEVF